MIIMRTTATVLLLTLPLALASCGDREGSSDATPTEPAVTEPATGGAEAAAEEETVLAGVSFDLPEGVELLPSASSMRLAEATVSAPGGAGEADLVFFYFGASGAGSIDDNIGRWTTLVVDEEGSPAFPQVEMLQERGLITAIVRLDGTYLAGPPAGPKSEMENHTLLGAIIEDGPEGPIYIRMTGPTPAVGALEPAFQSMIRSATPAS